MLNAEGVSLLMLLYACLVWLCLFLACWFDLILFKLLDLMIFVCFDIRFGYGVVRLLICGVDACLLDNSVGIDIWCFRFICEFKVLWLLLIIRLFVCWLRCVVAFCFCCGWIGFACCCVTCGFDIYGAVVLVYCLAFL